MDELGVPVKFVGVGEGIEDLQAFDAPSFVDALFPGGARDEVDTAIGNSDDE